MELESPKGDPQLLVLFGPEMKAPVGLGVEGGDVWGAGKHPGFRPMLNVIRP